MPSIAERVRELGIQEEQKRQAGIQRNEEEQREETEALSRQLEEAKRLIALIEPEKLLQEINESFLGSKGKIEKAEGIFTHEHWHAGRYDSLDWSETVSHPLSSVLLVWTKITYEIYKLRKKDRDRRREVDRRSLALGITVGADETASEIFSGRVFFSTDTKYLKPVNVFCSDDMNRDHFSVSGNSAEIREEIMSRLAKLCFENFEKKI